MHIQYLMSLDNEKSQKGVFFTNSKTIDKIISVA